MITRCSTRVRRKNDQQRTNAGEKINMANNGLIIYTDGASRGNPGPGGYGAILKWGSVEKEISKGYRLTTNNRMELMAVIAALESLKKEGLDIIVYSDSQYIVKAVEEGWLKNWI